MFLELTRISIDEHAGQEHGIHIAKWLARVASQRAMGETEDGQTPLEDMDERA